MKRWIILSAVVLFLLAGCHQEKEALGHMEELSIEQLTEKINRQDDFVLALTKTTCGPCQRFHENAQVYLQDHEEVIYYLVWDHQEDQTRARSLITSYVGNTNVTPDLFMIEQGKVSNRYWDDYDGLDEETLAQWIEKYRP